MRLGLIHTVPDLASTFDQLVKARLDAELIHVVDNWLLARAMSAGIGPDHAPRLLAHVRHLSSLGCTAALVTCSSIGEVTDEIAAEAGIPVVRVDRAMAGAAVALARAGTGRITALATLASTLTPTGRLLRARAGESVEVETRLVDGAAEARRSGDDALFTELISSAVRAARTRGDVVVLAQASMVEALGGHGDDLVLTSPPSARDALVEAATR